MFASDRDGDFDLFAIEIDSRNVVRLSDQPADDLYPSWSPDGTSIAFSSSRDNQYLGFVDQDIYVLELETGDVRRLGPPHIAGAVDVAPDWSPDGSMIVVAAESPELPSYGVNLLVVNEDGSGFRYLTRGESRSDVPSWSPDGLWIAYASAVDGDLDIYLTRVDGSGKRQLTNHPAPDFKPSWSPDGRRIAFESKRDGDADIYVMDIDGENLVQITDHPADDFMPAWSPDGAWIAFVSDRDGDADIYVLRVDAGSAQKKVN